MLQVSIPVEMLKRVCKIYVDLFNGCLPWGVFPLSWKITYMYAVLNDPSLDSRDNSFLRPQILKMTEHLVQFEHIFSTPSDSFIPLGKQRNGLLLNEAIVIFGGLKL